jgi:hypothetical protein
MVLYLPVKHQQHQGLLASVWLVQPSVAILRAYHFLPLLDGRQHLQQSPSFCHLLLCWAMSDHGNQEKNNYQNRNITGEKLFLKWITGESYLGILWTTFLFVLFQFCPTSTLTLNERLK